MKLSDDIKYLDLIAQTAREQKRNIELKRENEYLKKRIKEEEERLNYA